MSLLSDEQIEQIFDAIAESNHCTEMFDYLYARAIEAAVLEAQKQEPVAWIAHNDFGEEITISESNLRNKQPKYVQEFWRKGKPLFYAAPVVQPCEHHFVMDEEAVRHKCCQKCGLIAAAEGKK